MDVASNVTRLCCLSTRTRASRFTAAADIAAGLPVFKEQGTGHFVNVSSIGGHLVVPTGAAYCATRFAVRAISDDLQQESRDGRVTIISPGVVESELADTITDEGAKKVMAEFRANAIPPEAIARAILFAVEQPAGVSVSEIIVRPTGGA